MMVFRIGLSVLLVAGIGLLGCSPKSTSGKVYSRDQAQTTYRAFSGTVLEVQAVAIEGNQSGAGALAGGALGGALGSAAGGGAGKTIAVVGGAIIGALAGSATEKKVTGDDGLELLVELDGGEVLSVVQEADQAFAPGDRVRVLKGSDGTIRVRPGAVPAAAE
ncbi:MAG TPA: hypothetical protein VK997_14340 [Deferrisomatales bacterium]|nr:hypothetical protein [Deferrisomatales bacterium]